MSAGVLREAAFRVLRGDPTPDELGALVAVLTALRACPEAADDVAAESAAPRASWDRAGNGYRSPLAWVSRRTAP